MKINKPWGFEEIIYQSDNYVVKRLFMKKGHSCSLQYHEKKTETVYVISGKLKQIYNDNEYELEKDDYITILPKEVHRMEALEDSVYIECSTNYLDDVIRLEDRYGRI